MSLLIEWQVAQPLHPGGKHYPNVGLQSTNWREDSVLRYEHSDLTYEDEEIENPGHFMHRLGLDPQNAKNNELLKLMEVCAVSNLTPMSDTNER